MPVDVSETPTKPSLLPLLSLSHFFIGIFLFRSKKFTTSWHIHYWINIISFCLVVYMITISDESVEDYPLGSGYLILTAIFILCGSIVLETVKYNKKGAKFALRKSILVIQIFMVIVAIFYHFGTFLLE